jgi:hypothetical protein
MSFLFMTQNPEIHLMRSLIPIQDISDLRLPIEAFARQQLKYWYLQMKENVYLFQYNEMGNSIFRLPAHPVLQK